MLLMLDLAEYVIEIRQIPVSITATWAYKPINLFIISGLHDYQANPVFHIEIF
jgi:hypothetical protein